MANLKGTNIASPVRPFTDADAYPTAYANELLGGHYSLATLVARNSIPMARRLVGMTCYVSATDKIYRLINNPSTTNTQNSDWQDDTSSPDNITFSDGDTLETKIEYLDTLAAEKHITFVISPVKAEANDIEVYVPYKAQIVSIIGTVPAGVTITKDLAFNVEVYNGTSWVVVDTSTISQNHTSVTTVLTTPDLLAIGNKVRINVLTCQDALDNLVVLVGIQLTK